MEDTEQEMEKTREYLAYLKSIKNNEDEESIRQLDSMIGDAIRYTFNVNGTEEEKELNKEVLETMEGFLTHKNRDVRARAVTVVGYYWDKSKYKMDPFEIFLNDPDEIVRSVALHTWFELYDGLGDKKVMRYLYDLLMDKKQPLMVRAQAYQGIFLLIPRVNDVREVWPENMDEALQAGIYEHDLEKFEKNVDWELVEKWGKV